MSVPWKLALAVYFTVPSTASTMVTLPFAPLVTAVITRAAFSKVSLPNTPVVTLPSSARVAVSAAVSATAVTVRLITCVVVLPASSATVTVKLSLPA